MFSMYEDFFYQRDLHVVMEEVRDLILTWNKIVI